MRFLIVNDTLGSVGGANQACQRITGRLAEAGHQVHWVGRPDSRLPNQLLDYPNVKLTSLSISQSRGITAALHSESRNGQAAALVRTVAREWAPDVAIVCNVHNGLSPATISALSEDRVKTVFFPFDHWSWCVRKYNHREHVTGMLAPCQKCRSQATVRSIWFGCGGRPAIAAGRWVLRRTHWAQGGGF